MYRIALCALLGGVAALAQPGAQEAQKSPAEKPPAEVNQALRTRVGEFYSLLKSGDYRNAEKWIAEDTRDFYYSGPKPIVKAFEILGIEYSDHFTHAIVNVRTTEPVAIAGFPPQDVTMPRPTHWKIENGLWYAYEDTSKMKNPGGLQTIVQAAIDQATRDGGPPGMPKEMPTDAGFVMGKIEADRSEVKIQPGTTEKVAIVNKSPGMYTLEPGYPPKGIEAKLDRTEVGGGETATLTLTAGPEAVSGVYAMRVMPTGEILKFQVRVNGK